MKQSNTILLILLSAAFYQNNWAQSEQPLVPSSSKITKKAIMVPTFLNSQFVYPRIGSKVSTSAPMLMGFVRDAQNKPVKNKAVILSVDGKLLATTLTNKYGVWSYLVKCSQNLSKGWHAIDAVLLQSSIFARNTLFKVTKNHKNEATTLQEENLAPQALYRSGNVSATNSTLAFPWEGADINSSTPPIIGFLQDADRNPVEGEHVTLTIDNVELATVVSESNGSFSYTPTQNQALVDGPHTLEVFANESNVALSTIHFTIDTVAPDAPTITSPTEDQIITTNNVTFSGTAEPNASVFLYFDGNNYDDIADVDSEGNWSVDAFFDNGDHSVIAQQFDLATNASPLSDSISFTVAA